ncbi:condensation domain-containing protein [Kitasatospora sp. NBC_01287]|uniref:condensation domain-containing protein n=1 Tax=Kitasatospora sp. NBC_01287 TaxID=2903573 RepID=UPI002253783D|nr:condensation domain-containing protein [Kitasatospora sp. NBC_01287]MCX4750323.1 condensation domain-containing protein [Kitasatospora sp. NBC_01287]
MDPRENSQAPGADGRPADTQPAGAQPAATRPAATRKEEAMWLLERLVPGSNVNNVPGATVRVEGRLDPDLVLASVNALLRRHPVLRTVYHADATSLRKAVLPPEPATLPLERHRVASETELTEGLREFVARTFPLDGSPLVRLALFSTADADVLCLAVHHLVFDSTSSTVFLEELAHVYDLAAGGQDLTAIPVEEVPTFEERVPDDKSLAYWRAQLEGFDPDSGELWLGSRPGGSGTLAGDHRVHRLSAEASAMLRGAQRSLRAPDAVVLLAAYFLLLARHGAGPDFAVGLPVNIRDQKVQRTIGYHVNILPLRTTIDLGATFKDFVRQVRDRFLEAVAHADAPVDVLLADAPRIEATWRSALFRHVFNFLPGRGTREYRIGGLPGRLEIVETGSSKFDLEFLIVPIGEGYEIKAIYSTDVHTADEVELLLERYDELLSGLGRDPELALGAVPAFSDTDRAVLGAAAGPTFDGPGLVPALAARVAAEPDAVAVQEPSRSVSYRQLWQAALATRELLVAHGVGRADTVGVSAAPGAELLAAALGCWLAGASYVPLTELTADADADVKLVLAAPGAASAAVAERLPLVALAAPGEGGLPEPLTAAPDPDAEAVGELTHRQLAVLLSHFSKQLATGDGAGASTAAHRVDALWRSPLGAEGALLEVWLPLATGGRIVLAAEEAALTDTLAAHPDALLQAPATDWWRLLAAVEGRLLDRPVLVTGAGLNLALAARLRSAGARPHTLRGWWGAAALRAAGTRVPAELTPLAGVRAEVTAPDGGALPIGVRGEIRVAASGALAPTGLLGRWTREGDLEVLGELGRRLRRKGGAVQPEQVEQVLAGHPSVAAAAVLELPGPGAADPVLVALVQRVPGLRQDDPQLIAELQDLATARLPHAAVPDRIAVLAALPSAPDGTVDQLALPAVATEALALAGPGGDEHLPLLVGLWQELIGRPDLDADANFFTSGGHSLLAAQLVQRVEERTGVRLRLADAFEHPTPAALAARMTAVARAA